MAQFREKPVVIEAREYTGDNRDEIAEFVGDGHGRHEGEVVLLRWEVNHLLGVGHWVCKNAQGLFFGCAPDFFAATYEPISE